ncbi:MAG TPA: metal-dependent hydrolase [Burkholderiales bacterium]|nr:metal-dependent hydrolase [Burkholderiales bacterium]
MDTLTHALSGALAARATAPSAAPLRAVPRRVAAGFFACAAPDLDFVIRFLGPVEFLQFHRGVTHSLLMLPLWALALAWLFAKLLREPGGWRALYGVCALALAMHIVGDVITSFGTMVFAPLSNWRISLGTTFIIDLWFSGIIVGGLIAAALFRRTRIPAVAASVLLAGYVGLQWVQKQRAEEIGRQYAAARGLSGAVVHALPRPVSPFNWTVFVSDASAHHFAHINLLRREPRALAADDGFVARLDAAYLPVAQAQWETRSRFGESVQTRRLVREAWNAPAFAFFRWFADKPAFDGISQGSTCVWFTDLRFLTPGRSNVPFRYGVCRAREDALWAAYQRAGPTGRTRIEPLD